MKQNNQDENTWKDNDDRVWRANLQRILSPGAQRRMATAEFAKHLRSQAGTRAG